MVSVIIPSKNEKYLERTIRNVLENARGEIEVLAVLDAWLPEPKIDIGDSRVTFLHFPEGIGQRGGINEAARRAKGEFIMKLDAHCAVGEGFDVILAQDCEPDWTVIPRMYNLDSETWKPKLHKRTDYMYIGNEPGRELRAEYYGRSQPKNDREIDDIMCCMGPCFFMRKDRFWELGGCDEGHGGWGQQGVEVSLKAWLSGGRMVVNKKTWFAHWFRGGGGPGFPYPITGRDQEAARKYSQDLWLNDKWPLAKRKLQWVIDKFNPPGWKKPVTDNIHRDIRHKFDVLVRDDFSPIGAHKGNRETLIEVWKNAGYKTGAEIGVKQAAFSEKILTGIPDVKLYCVDPWDVYKESHLSKQTQSRNYARAMSRLAPFGARASVVKEYSQKAVEQFKDGSLDFLFIDGMHTFDGCALDLILWVPKVRQGGMVAVHDYVAMRRGGVIEAVDAYTRCHMIHPWYVTREELPTAFWVRQ
jgi:hypothetical protein